MKSLWRGFAWWPMQARLVALAVLAATPLVGLTVYEAARSIAQARQVAARSVAERAELVQRQLDDIATKADHLLTFLANRREVQSLDAQACTELFVNMLRIDPAFANAGFIAKDGQPVCASVSNQGRLPSNFASREWFDRALKAQGLAVGEPHLGLVVGRPTLGLAKRVRSLASGEILGVVMVAVDLIALSRDWEKLGLPPNSVVASQTADGKVMARYPNPDLWIGKNVSQTVNEFRGLHPMAPGLFVGPDEVSRLYALKVSTLGWTTVVGIPEAQLLAQAREELKDGAVRLVAVVVAALLLAGLMARRMAGPIEQLRSVAQRVTDGEREVRADLDVPPELRPVALEFNRMLETQLQQERATRRIAAMYAALARTNRAIVLGDEPSALASEVCAACVDSGHSRLAVVYLGGGPRMARVAAHGAGSAELMDPIADRGSGGHADESLVAELVAGGGVVVSNDFGRDSRPLPLQDHPATRHARAFAAFPLVHPKVAHGHVVGALLVFLDAKGGFDDQVTGLLAEMARDLAYGIGEADRERARREAEEAARLQSERFRRLFDTVPVNVAVRSLVDGTLLNANERLLATVGMPLGRVVGNVPWALGFGVPPDVEQPLLSELAHGSGRLRNLQLRVTGTDGQPLDLLINAQRIEYDGRPAALVASLDITSLNRAEQTLRTREQQLAGIVESAMDAIVTVDVDQRIRVFNAAAGRMFGLPPQEAIGQPLERFIPAADRSAHEAHVRSFAAGEGRLPQRMAPRRDLRALRADGTEFPIEASISRTGEGQGLLMTAVVRDLTEVHAAQQAREAQLAAQVASQAKSDFIANVGHELRTPLNAVLGFLNLVVMDHRQPLDAEHRRLLMQAREGGWHLAGLIDDLLDLSRIEAGQLRVQRAPVPVHEVVEAAVSLARAQAEQRQVSMLSNLAQHNAVVVLADRARLRQVLINLLSNGAKYNRPGGQVVVSVREAGDNVELTVKDDGIGMTRAQRERLFRRFDRLGRESSYVEGTGIGLALSKKLVEAMNGSIEVDSEVGAGTTVTVILPGTRDVAPVAPATDVAPSAQQVLEGRVLYVEDEPVNILLVQEYCRRHPGLSLSVAETGAEGLRLLQSERFDLVLLDRGLPDMDGLEVLAKHRQETPECITPVVMLSASAMERDVEACRAAGASDYWTKPIDFERWGSDLARILGASRGPAQLVLPAQEQRG